MAKHSTIMVLNITWHAEKCIYMLLEASDNFHTLVIFFNALHVD